MPRIREWLSLAGRALQGKPRALAGAIVLITLVLAASVGTFAWFCFDLTAGLPDRKEMRALGDMAQATTIYDARDQAAFTIFKEQRIEIPLEKISPNLVKAVLAIEDQRFFDHKGVDFIRVAAAGLENLKQGRRAEGGSTITQQLARLSFLSRDKTYRRKMKEIILAARIERQYSKKDILELYLNKVYFGDGLYGVEAASLGYFGKHADSLSIAEAALLAGLIQSPSTYAPTVNLDRAVARRNIVLQAMASAGAIDAATFERAKRAAVHLANSVEMKETFGLYFKEEVRKQLVEKFGGARVSQGGLRVYTTLDPDLQRLAEKAVEDGTRAIERRPRYPHQTRDKAKNLDYLQGALLAMDPQTGAVRAMVGGRDFGESHFNRATQAKRQAGSAFKPFVYAAAIEGGDSPATVISNLNDPILTAQGDWVPEDEHSTATSLTLRSALRMSSNRAAVQLLRTIGIPRAVSYAQKLNVGTPPSVPSLALGAMDVTLMSLTSAYGAFAAEGVVHQPVLIRRVDDADGKTIYRDPGKAQQAISKESAFLMSSMLADVITAGTAYRARQAGFTLPAAGKTGTTNDFVDAWFVGFTPHLLTGVWVGFDRPKTIVRNGFAADLAVPIWTAFMKPATKDDKPDWIVRPDDVVGVTVCRMSGKLPNAGCGNVQTMTADGDMETRSMVYTDYFVRGTQPTTLCPLHPGGYFADALSEAAGTTGTIAAPPRLAQPGPAPLPPQTSASAAGASQAPVAPPPKPPAPKKRGFWGRLFGRGGGGGAP
ncbi:MAG TPA: PBP1A family penicillin-binding protein [Vicinamibacterales bacterium]|nr:PBP1A family penicillin-binding protein [Vicinamibacterales bacterium]